jgi:hypothetical protein
MTDLLRDFCLGDFDLSDDRDNSGAVFVGALVNIDGDEGFTQVGCAEMTIQRDSEDIEVYLDWPRFMDVSDTLLDALRDRFRGELWSYAAERIDNLSE